MIGIDFSSFGDFKGELLSRFPDVRDCTIRLHVERLERFPFVTVTFVFTAVMAREDGDPDLLRLRHDLGSYTKGDETCERMVETAEKTFTHVLEQAGFTVRDGEFTGRVSEAAEGTQPGVGCTGL